MKQQIKVILAGIVCSLGASTAFGFGGAAAIVYNPITHAFGSYHGASTRFDAETAALENCGADCAGIDAYALEAGTSGLHETWAYNGWAAFSINGTGRWGGSGIHDSQSDAESSAYNNCGGAADNCYILRSLSSYVDYPDQDGDDPSQAPAASTVVGPSN
jgi:hypothetical protein